MLDTLNKALSVARKPITNPIRLEKVASTLKGYAKTHADINRFGFKSVRFEEAVFGVRQLCAIFDIVGRKAVGYIAQSPELFEGEKFMVVLPEDFNRGTDTYGILLQNNGSTLVQSTVFGRTDKVQRAIERLKTFEPNEGYYLAFSGGKDSQCVYHLAKVAGVRFDAHYAVTTVDPPELMRFILRQYPDVEWERKYWPDDPKYNLPGGIRRQITMWNLIADHTAPPTRVMRYCCAALKETGGEGRVVITGTRWAESVRRRDLHGIVDIRTASKKWMDSALRSNEAATLNSRASVVFMDDNDETRKLVESCYIRKRTTVNPIIDWEESDVWEFLDSVAKVPHCSLYDEGFTRIGCIGCPLAGRENMLRDFERWPRYKELYIRAFDKMLENHPGEIKVATGEPASGGGSILYHWCRWIGEHGRISG